jgi:hypothetical protein
LARAFDDAQSQYLIYNSAILTAAPFSFACWVYCDDVVNQQTAFWLGDKDAATSYWALFLRGNQVGDPVTFNVRQGGQTLIDTTSGYSANTWHHIACVETASNDHAVFIDGGSKSTDNTNLAPANADVTALARENDSSPAKYLSGSLAEAGLWNVGLTDAEVAELAAGFSPPFVRPQGLVAYWRLIRDDKDVVGGYDLTANGGVTTVAHPPKIFVPAPLFLTVPPAADGDVTVTPSPASAVMSTVNPTVILGSLSVTPSNANAVVSTVNPTVVLGSQTVAPTAASAVVSTVNPTVVLGNVTVTPAAASAVMSTVNPTVELGSVSVTPAAASAVMSTVSPTVVLGSLTVTPSNANAVVSTVDPSVTIESGPTVEPNPATAVVSTVSPTVILGSVSVSPAAASAVVSTPAPTVVLGSQSVTPVPASAVVSTVDPSVTIAAVGVTVTPSAASAVMSTVNPTVEVYGSTGPIIQAAVYDTPAAQGAVIDLPTVQAAPVKLPAIKDAEEF